MPRILLLYSTFDGQTRRIAERMAEVLQYVGNETTLLPAETSGACAEIARHDAIVVGAAIRYGHHAPTLVRFVKSHSAALAARPNAFFSVCLSAGGPGAKPAEARRYVEDFVLATGWHPGATASFAGALRYSHYNPLIRLLMRLIVRMAGGETDTSRDYEYTDWAAVERFAHQIFARITTSAAA